jgi:hypothetical protein
MSALKIQDPLEEGRLYSFIVSLLLKRFQDTAYLLPHGDEEDGIVDYNNFLHCCHLNQDLFSSMYHASVVLHVRITHHIRV